jgi:hypothetical protein
VVKLGVNAEARRFSEPGAGIPHSGILSGADGQIPVLRYLGLDLGIQAVSSAITYILGLVDRRYSCSTIEGTDWMNS